MSRNFTVDFNLERQEGQTATFRLEDNAINANFNIAETNSMNVTFDIAQANKDKYFVFEQGTSSAVWTINHNLNKKASVTVVDEYDRVVTPAVEYVNDNKIILRFNFAFKGRAYLN